MRLPPRPEHGEGRQAACSGPILATVITRARRHSRSNRSGRTFDTDAPSLTQRTHDIGEWSDIPVVEIRE
jgi:hypothetical protein